MIKRTIAFTSVGVAMLAATAIAQTSAPSSSPTAAPSATPAVTAGKTAAEQNLAGQGKWRASKLMGVDIYGPDDKKVGDITEVLFDKTGKVEMVTIGVGGFLGIGAKDVAVPFDQVTWSDQPMAASAPAPTGGTAAPSPSAPAAVNAARAPAMYPDHGKITLTKEQLTSAPAVTYSGT